MAADPRIGQRARHAQGHGGRAGEALAVHSSVEVRLFGKPGARPGRRMGVALATAGDTDIARERARAAAAAMRVAP
mgnify:CR=1 FL=1